MMRGIRALLVLIALAGTGGAQLDDGGYARLREAIAMEASELAWARLPWLMSYRAGLVEAAKQERPLLLWVMNGHPFGCT